MGVVALPRELQALIEKLVGIEGVARVYASEMHPRVYVTVVMSTSDKEQQHRVYDAELAILDAFPQLRMELLVLNETKIEPGCIEGITPSGSNEIYKRALRANAS